MINIEALPDGIIIDLLTCGVLNHKDVLKFSLTCKRFCGLASTNSVWKQLFLFDWSSLIKENGKFHMFVEGKKDLKVNDDESNFCHWKILFSQVHQTFIHLNKILINSFHEDYLDDETFNGFTKLCQKYSFDFVSAILHDVIVSKDQSVCLTNKYYAVEVYRFLHQQWLKPQIDELLCQKAENSENKDTLSLFIKGAVLIESWFNPLDGLSFSYIDDFIDAASKQAMEIWKTVYSAQYQNDPDKATHFKYLALNEVFFKKLKFHGNQGDYFNVSNSFIHQVIATRHGIPILLSIIYREIAGKIGLDFECVNNPNHFILRWQTNDLDVSKQPTMVDIAKAYSYIDVFNNGRLLAKNQLNPSILKVESATLNEVLHRIALNVDAHSRISDPTANVQRSLSALNLCLLFEPNNHRTRAKRLQLNLSYNINLAAAIQDNQIIPKDARKMLSMVSAEEISKVIKKTIKKKEKEKQSYKPKIYLRSKQENANVRYAVGMVMHHRRYDYICVIRGWDNRCRMPLEWVNQMGVFNMERGVLQPFYHVLVDKDGSQRYAAEDSLEMIPHREELDHPEIGRYFTTTKDLPTRHYISNTELNLRYPEDADFLCCHLQAQYGAAERRHL